MKKGNGVLKQITSGMVSETDVMPGHPIIEIFSNCRVLVELHNGIIEYGQNKIVVSVRYGYVCICGHKLEVVRMTAQQLVIAGEIASVQLLRR